MCGIEILNVIYFEQSIEMSSFSRLCITFQEKELTELNVDTADKSAKAVYVSCILMCCFNGAGFDDSPVSRNQGKAPIPRLHTHNATTEHSGCFFFFFNSPVFWCWFDLISQQREIKALDRQGTQQQRSESPMGTWHASEYRVHINPNKSASSVCRLDGNV